MAQNATPPTSQSKVRELESNSVVWELKNWKKTHDVLVAANASCLLEFEKPKVLLRFFLKPVFKMCATYQAEYRTRYYALCADVLESNVQGVAKIVAKVVLGDGRNFTVDGQVKLWSVARDLGLVVVEEFIPVQVLTLDGYGLKQVSPFHPNLPAYHLWQQRDLSIDICATLYQLSDNDGGGDAGGARPINPETEASMMRLLKIMYAAEDNYSDLKLETKGNVTLSAHKFQLAAISPVFGKMIKEAVGTPGFDGVLKIGDVNAIPLAVILHWIYSGELHENSGKVMEEVVEAAMKYQLGDMLKILDKQMIQICNVKNMFQLIQVARKVPLPTAIDDISGFIKGNL